MQIISVSLHWLEILTLIKINGWKSYLGNMHQVGVAEITVQHIVEGAHQLCNWTIHINIHHQIKNYTINNTRQWNRVATELVEQGSKDHWGLTKMEYQDFAWYSISRCRRDYQVCNAAAWFWWIGSLLEVFYHCNLQKDKNCNIFVVCISMFVK